MFNDQGLTCSCSWGQSWTLDFLNNSWSCSGITFLVTISSIYLGDSINLISTVVTILSDSTFSHVATIVPWYNLQGSSIRLFILRGMTSLLVLIMDFATKSPFLYTNNGVGSITPVPGTFPPTVAPGTIISHLGGISKSFKTTTLQQVVKAALASLWQGILSPLNPFDKVISDKLTAQKYFSKKSNHKIQSLLIFAIKTLWSYTFEPKDKVTSLCP